MANVKTMFITFSCSPIQPGEGSLSTLYILGKQLLKRGRLQKDFPFQYDVLLSLFPQGNM